MLAIYLRIVEAQRKIDDVSKLFGEGLLSFKVVVRTGAAKESFDELGVDLFYKGTLARAKPQNKPPFSWD